MSIPTSIPDSFPKHIQYCEANWLSIELEKNKEEYNQHIAYIKTDLKLEFIDASNPAYIIPIMKVELVKPKHKYCIIL